MTVHVVMGDVHYAQGATRTEAETNTVTKLNTVLVDHDEPAVKDFAGAVAYFNLRGFEVTVNED
jgi:hypothetical protein